MYLHLLQKETIRIYYVLTSGMKGNRKKILCTYICYKRKQERKYYLLTSLMKGNKRKYYKLHLV